MARGLGRGISRGNGWRSKLLATGSGFPPGVPGLALAEIGPDFHLHFQVRRSRSATAGALRIYFRHPHLPAANCSLEHSCGSPSSVVQLSRVFPLLVVEFARIKGVGSTTATAFVAAVGDGSEVKNGRHLSGPDRPRATAVLWWLLHDAGGYLKEWEPKAVVFLPPDSLLTHSGDDSEAQLPDRLSGD